MNTAAKEFIPKIKPDTNMFPPGGPIAFIAPYYDAVPMYIDPNLPVPIYSPPTATNSFPNDQIADEEEEFEEEEDESLNMHTEDMGKITYVKKVKEEAKVEPKVEAKVEAKVEVKEAIKEEVKQVIVQVQDEKKEAKKVLIAEENVPKEKQPESKNESN